MKKILGNEKENIGKINEQEYLKISKEITFNEVKIGVKELRLSASGGADGITGRLLKLLFSFIPKLIYNAVKEIANGTKKPIELTERFLNFIKKPNSNKKTYKRFRPINLISNLLKITSKIIESRIEQAVVNSVILPRTVYAYYKERSTVERYYCRW